MIQVDTLIVYLTQLIDPATYSAI